MALTLADLGEQEVLRRLHRFCDEGVGDDAAVHPVPDDQRLVVTTDVLVDGVHFSDRTLPPQDLGWRAAAANLSDLAAMGAQPLGLTVGLSLPPSTPWPWLEAVYQGLSDCLASHGGTLLGGDLCRSPHRSLAITALGAVLPHQVLYRHRALAHQTLVSTGGHGAARAGLALLLQELKPIHQAEHPWIAAHQRPQPRFDAVAALHSLALKTGAMAAMDSSDGLADAVLQICQRSQVGARLLRSQLPLPPSLADTVGLAKATQWCLYGGEDFELILSLPTDAANAFVKALSGSQIIGHTTPETTVRLVDDITHGPDVVLEQSQGFQHF